VSRIVLMGSGETAPAMVKTHRAVLAASGEGPAVMLDTPYGFQVNADDLTNRTLRYFEESVGQKVVPASWRRRELDAAERERVLAQVSRAAWLFAGPGSPTYALNQWHGTPLVGAIGDVVDRGGTVVLGSAAAVTAGRWALPVYEIYKVGTAPYWAEGLDLLTRFLDLPVAVIPHYDNAEGGTYDTRFCYLGEDRLRILERELPDSAAVLGIDEHTAVIVDLGARTVEVSGVGHLTVRRHARNERIPSGTTLTVDELGSIVAGVRHVAIDTSPGEATTGEPDLGHSSPTPSLDADVESARALFDAAMAGRDVDAAVAALLSLDDALAAWSADTLQSDALDRGRRELRAMVVRLGELARSGAADPSVALAPVVEAVLAVRTSARDDKDFAMSDRLRDALVAGGIVVMDTPDGSTWSIEGPDDEGPGTPP
jgi:cyanophycinase-like exopeptidase